MTRETLLTLMVEQGICFAMCAYDIGLTGGYGPGHLRGPANAVRSELEPEGHGSL